MDVKNFILKYIKKHKTVKISELVKKTGFTRSYLHIFLKELQDEGKILLIGKTNQAHYVLVENGIDKIKKPKRFRRTFINRNLFEDLVLTKIKNETSIFEDLKKNVVDILDYTFSEMFNNAIEHSHSKKILAQMEKRSNIIEFRVIDWGVGIFNDIKKKFKLKDIFEAIGLLIKGKHTSKPKTHTGEGIFFTSKVASKMFIKSSFKKLVFDNVVDDVFVGDSKKAKGTEIIFIIFIDSKKKMTKIFGEYTNNNFSFEKTKVVVKLFESRTTSYISRSQARRLLFGLNKFKIVVLDFKGIEIVGQAFADEVFRVWQGKYPKIKIESINYNENVKFMIDHVLAKKQD